MLSLWSWRQHRDQISVTFDDFLSAIEDGSQDRLLAAGAQYWSNWPIYTIDDKIVADDIIRFENLQDDLKRVFGPLGAPVPDALPRIKSGHRRAPDEGVLLTPSRVERIALLCRDEIEAFGYLPPRMTG